MELTGEKGRMGKVRNASKILLGKPDRINNCVWPKMAPARDKGRTYVNRERKQVPEFYTRRGVFANSWETNYVVSE